MNILWPKSIVWQNRRFELRWDERYGIVQKHSMPKNDAILTLLDPIMLIIGSDQLQ